MEGEVGEVGISLALVAVDEDGVGRGGGGEGGGHRTPGAGDRAVVQAEVQAELQAELQLLQEATPATVMVKVSVAMQKLYSILSPLCFTPLPYIKPLLAPVNLI